MKLLATTLAALSLSAGFAMANAHTAPQMIDATDQSVASGIVSADLITSAQTGWLVVHRTDAEMAPGAFVGYAPLRAGRNVDVAAILTEDVAPGDMLMLVLHGEEGGTRTGIFEYTLGAAEDGPVVVDGGLVMTVITAL